MSGDEPRIVIIGGVAGGATAAARARRMNEHAEIIMLERGKYVSFANCGLPYYIGGDIQNRDDLLVATPQKFHDWFKIDVRTGHEAVEIKRDHNQLVVREVETDQSYELDYDRLILSPGARPIVPPFDGIHSANVFTLRNLGDTDRVKNFLNNENIQHVTVVGAGFIGLEMVEMFRKQNLEVDLVELTSQVMPPMDSEMAHLIEKELVEHEVNLYLDNGLDSLQTEADRVSGVVLEDGTQRATDLVMICIGVKPNTELAEQAGLDLGSSGGIRVNTFMQTSDPEIYAVGDAVEYKHQVTDLFNRFPLAGPANRSGRIAGEHAATGQAPHMQPVQGTAIVKVFNQAAALTGLSEKEAEELCEPCESVWIPGKQHAGYYPGARRLTVKLNYSPEDGQVLGAQVVGEAGVDKRIDVIATAIHFDATVEDLIGLDLAYAPPYGSAKDIVHMAGFAAHNQLRGQASFEKEFQDNGQILDVRTPQEFQDGHVEGSINIPLGELRSRLDQLDKNKPIDVMCAIGKRSYYAQRILLQEGFEHVNIIGAGMFLQ